jgi:hypothetical protein
MRSNPSGRRIASGAPREAHDPDSWLSGKPAPCYLAPPNLAETAFQSMALKKEAM